MTDTNEPDAPAGPQTEPIDGGSKSVSVRVMIEVVAGLVPGTPMPEYTRRWAITSAEWQTAHAQDAGAVLLAERNGQAQGYAALLMLQPDALNWVRTDWIWL
jgi:hypothetical protein